MKWIAVSLASLTLLAGCVTDGAGTSPCAGWRPILVSRADTLTQETARQILAHNEVGARLCRW
jgi:hypothetical protein